MRRIPFSNMVLLAAMFAPAQAGAATIYITDFNSNLVNAYSAATGTFLGTLVSGSVLDGASGIRVGPDGNLYVTSQNTNDVLRFDPTGAALGAFVSAGSGGLSSPQDLLFAPNGNLLVASSANDEVLEYDGATGAFLSTFSTLASPDHDGPIAIAFGPDGDLYVTAFDGSRILKLDGSNGNLLGASTAVADTAFVGITFGADGTLLASGISTTDFTGSVFSFDRSSMTETGTFIPIGSGGLSSPAALATDALGNILVLDAGTASLLLYDSTGTFENALVTSGDGGLTAPLFFTASVPEPGSLEMAGIGVLLFGMVCWRRKPRPVPRVPV